MMERSIHFEKIGNARDLGGLTTTEGKVIRTGCLIRSAGLFEATANDIRKLQEEYRLQTIIDLRTGMEKEERPDRFVPGAVYCPNPIFDERVVGISHEKEKIDLRAMPGMEELYRMMVTEETCRRNLGNAARKVFRQDFSEGSVLWHCTEGKDRCGLLAAAVLMALGVSREVMMEDYLLTNAVNAPKAQRFYEGMLAAGKSRQEAEIIRGVFLAKESYLQSAFDGIDAAYTDDWNFLTEGLGIPEETILTFREQVLA